MSVKGVVAFIVGVLLLAFLYGWWERRRGNKGEGRYEAVLAALDSARAALARQARVHDTVYRVDTVRLTQSVTKYQRLRDSVLVNLHDTVLVKETINAGSEFILACRQTVSDCEKRIADRDAQIETERNTRATSDSLWRSRLSLANPRVLPYAEALVDPFQTSTAAFRGGLEIRAFGPLRLVGALEYHTKSSSIAPLVGARVTF